MLIQSNLCRSDLKKNVWGFFTLLWGGMYITVFNGIGYFTVVGGFLLMYMVSIDLDFFQ